MKPFLSVIVPNRADFKPLPLTLLELDKKLSESEFSYEILVVNGGSNDKTDRMISRFGRVVKNLKFLEIKETKENRGLGWILRSGMLAARGNYRLFICGVSMPVSGIEGVFPYFKEGYQLIVGSGNYPTFGFFTEEAAARIFNSAKINGWGFMKEAIALSRLFGFRVKEIRATGGTRLTMGSYLSFLWDLIRVRYWLKRDVYSIEKRSF